jgi:hypothetical protein
MRRDIASGKIIVQSHPVVAIAIVESLIEAACQRMSSPFLRACFKKPRVASFVPFFGGLDGHGTVKLGQTHIDHAGRATDRDA